MTARARLPNRRAREGFDFRHRGVTFKACIGFYPDGRVGELFLSTTKAGTDVDGDARDLALLFSLLIQRGEPLENIKAALTKDVNGEPSGILGQALERLGEGT